MPDFNSDDQAALLAIFISNLPEGWFSQEAIGSQAQNNP